MNREICACCGGDNTGPSLVAPSVAARRSLCIRCAREAFVARSVPSVVTFVASLTRTFGNSLALLSRRLTEGSTGEAA